MPKPSGLFYCLLALRRALQWLPMTLGVKPKLLANPHSAPCSHAPPSFMLLTALQAHLPPTHKTQPHLWAFTCTAPLTPTQLPPHFLQASAPTGFAKQPRDLSLPNGMCHSLHPPPALILFRALSMTWCNNIHTVRHSLGPSEVYEGRVACWERGQPWDLHSIEPLTSSPCALTQPAIQHRLTITRDTNGRDVL